MEQVHRAIHEAVLEAGPKQLAHLMGMSHTALFNRSNPNDDSHRLNLEQFLQILVHSKNPEPLQLLACALGYELVPLVPGKNRSEIASSTLPIPNVSRLRPCSV